MSEHTWIDRQEYSFQSNYLPLEMGRRHYVDEGSGEPIVMVHGNPAWSFLYRYFIKGLSPDYRCVAPDHIGFGPKDIAFREKELDGWQHLLPDCQVHRLEGVGHFVQEEYGREAVPILAEFLR